MGAEEYKEQLQALSKQLTEAECLAVIRDRLGKNPSPEEREILENYLGAYSHIAPGRVAKYWEPFLSSDDAFQREMVARELSLLVQCFSDPLAYRLLTDFFGEEPSPDKLDDIFRERMLQLFPGYKQGRYKS